MRWRMVWQQRTLGFKLDKVAETLCVDTSTVHRIVTKFDATGEVSKKRYSKRKAFQTSAVDSATNSIAEALHLPLGNAVQFERVSQVFVNF